eukprot:1730799-Alexandrium_andersonii.AAC.1
MRLWRLNIDRRLNVDLCSRPEFGSKNDVPFRGRCSAHSVVLGRAVLDTPFHRAYSTAHSAERQGELRAAKVIGEGGGFAPTFSEHRGGP